MGIGVCYSSERDEVPRGSASEGHAQRGSEFKVEYAEFIQELCVSLVGVVEEKGKIQRSAEWCVWRTRTVHNPSEWGGTGPRGRRMGEDDEEGKHGTGACEKYCVRNAVGRIARSPRKPSEGG